MSTTDPRPEILPVGPDQVPDSEMWRDVVLEAERLSRSDTQVARNASTPSLTAYLPDPAIATGTGVIVCPGGAFFCLSIDKEGGDVARWLTARGIGAFVLRFRVVPTPDDETLQAIAANLTPHRPEMDLVRAQANPARHHAGPPKHHGPLRRRPGRRRRGGDVHGRGESPHLIDGSSNTSLHEAWYAAGRRAELHLHAQGGHDFGPLRQGLPSDGWIDRFYEWLGAEGFVPGENTPQ